MPDTERRATFGYVLFAGAVLVAAISVWLGVRACLPDAPEVAPAEPAVPVTPVAPVTPVGPTSPVTPVVPAEPPSEVVAPGLEDAPLESGVAYVRPEKGGRGSAFCIDGRGLFIASWHVVRDSEIVILALSSGTPQEKEVRARVLRASRDMDLVLLRTVEPGGFRALPLGKGDIAAGATVRTLGFPSVPGDESPGGTNPPLSESRGKVASPAEAAERSGKIRLDLVAYPGNSGGPILGDDGLVVGVVAEGAPGQPTTFAVPTAKLREFLAEPEIVFEPPAVVEQKRSAPLDFRCQVLSLDGSGIEGVSVALKLADPGQSERTCEFRRLDRDTFHVSAAPASGEGAPGADGPAFEISVRRGGKTIARKSGTLPVVDLKRGLLAHFALDEDSGATARDSSGGGCDGVLVGNPARFVDGANGVLELHGRGDAIDVLVPPNLEPGAGMTLCLALRSSPGGGDMWMRGEKAVPQQELLTTGTLPGWPQSWGPVSFQIGVGARVHRPVKPLDDGGWHHLSFTRDPQAAEGAMYVDGSVALQGGLADLAAPGGALSVGRTGSGPHDTVHFRGQLDEVRLYGRVLNRAEIRALAEQFSARAQPR